MKYKIITGIALFVIIASLSIPLFTGPLIKKMISDSTENKISLVYKDSHINILTGNFTFDSVTLQFHNIIYDSSLSLNIDNLSFNSISLERLNIFNLFTSGKIKLHKLILESPDLFVFKDTLYLHGQKVDRKLFFDIFKKDDKSGAERKPFEFELDELELINGGFEYTDENNKKIKVGKLDLTIKDLEDENFIPGKKLFDFNIKVTLTGVETVSNYLYKTRIDTFSADSKAGRIHLKGVSFTPKKVLSNDNPVNYSGYVGSLTIEGIKPRDILTGKNFHLKKIIISNSGVTVNYFSKPKKEKFSIDTSSLFNLFSAYKIDTIALSGLEFFVLKNNSDTAKRIKIKRLEIGNVLIDKASTSGLKDNPLLKQISVISEQVSLFSSSPAISISYSKLFFNGKKSSLGIKDAVLKLNCSPPDNDTVAKCEFSSATVKIKGFPEYWFSDKSTVKTALLVDNWSVKISNPQYLLKNNNKNTFELPEKIFFDTLALTQGNIELSDDNGTIFKTGNTALRYSDLTIFTFSKTANKKVDYRSFASAFDKLEFRPDEKSSVKINRGRLSDGRIVLSGVSISNYTGNNGIVTTGKLHLLHLKNFDLKNLINNNKLFVNNITINKPSIFLTDTRQSITAGSTATDSLFFEKLRDTLAMKAKKYFDAIRINSVKIAEGKLLYDNISKKISISTDIKAVVTNIDFIRDNPSQIWQYANLELSLLNSGVSASGTLTTCDSTGFNTIDNIAGFKNITFRTVNTDNNVPEIYAFIPAVEITETSFNRYLYHPLTFGKINISGPVLNMTVKSKDNDDTKKSPLTGDIPFSLLREYIKMENGKIKLKIESPDDTTLISAGSIDAIWYEKPPQPSAPAPFTAQEQMHKAGLKLKGLKIENKKSKLYIENIHHPVNGNNIDITGIKQSAFKKTTSGYEKTSKVSIPEVTVDNPLLHKSRGKLANVDFESIKVPQVNIDLYKSNKKTGTHKPFNFKDTTLRPLFNYLGHFNIGSTTIENIHFRYIPSDSSENPIDITQMSLFVKGIKIDSSVFVSHKSVVDDISLRLYDREFISKDSLYLIKVNDVSLLFTNDKLILDSVMVIPRFGKEEFFKKAGYQTDRMKIAGKRITVNGLDFESLITGRIYHFNSIILDGFNIVDRRDQTYPRKPGVYRKLPQSLLRSINTKLIIDSVKLKNSYLLYGEYAKKSKTPGEIYLTELDATVKNITNVQDIIKENPVMSAKVSCKIMDDARFSGILDFSLIDSSDFFEYSASLETFDLTKLNPMVQNLMGLSIKKGKGRIENLAVQGDNEIAKGELLFKYRKLKLELYNRSKAKEVKGIASPFISFLLNNIVVKSNNPKPLGRVRKGEVYFERAKEKSIFNYLWKSTLSGILSTMGINNKQQKEALKKERKSYKDEIKLNKQLEKERRKLENATKRAVSK